MARRNNTRRGSVDISMALDDLAYELGLDEDFTVADTEYTGGELIVWFEDSGNDGVSDE